MKTSLKKIASLIGAIALSLNLAFAGGGVKGENEITASDKFAFSVYAIQKTVKFRLAFDNEESKTVLVKIFDANNKVIHQDYIKGKTEMRRDYDLETVGKGIYSMEISCGDYRAVRKIAVGGAVLEAKSFEAYISPSLNSDGYARVAFQNAAEGAYIVIKDSNEAILYSERDEANSYSRRFNLSQLKKGTYTLLVTSGDKTVEQTYEVR